ncbi:Holliday junction branch migration DNA helicase RuvB [Mesoplasma syrphidae]|uniref:Holliday junction branch migration complex subunit RuvB n=1 Tax=Mesoplasma syrphidae TaxID=225999 RepID=A0A2K9C265_9MOLU|nr:Holliday junction branch migration DNA helicase RuvB [Mesoplasma syrphidae]AUF83569.1 Holliday junction branch migration DNA helicase RuvB [Mesoplasma syrphidae]
MVNNNFRPNSWNEFLGQSQIISNLKIYVESARQQNKTLDHLLIHGSSGMGKTSLAFLISKVMKSKLHILNGPSIQKPSDLIAVLSALKPSDILFIDEVHAISKEILEILYPVLEDNKMNLVIGKDYNSKIINVSLPEFTIICATTEIYKLSYPLLNRFPIHFQIMDYSLSEMSQIIKNASNRIDLQLSTSSCEFIASYCRNTPRIAINLVNRIKDYIITKHVNCTNIVSLKTIFKQMGIYSQGLTNNDVEYLKILKEHKTLGIESLAQILDAPIATIIQNIEPVLIREQFVLRTLRGRMITDKGLKYLSEIFNKEAAN